MLVTLTHSKDWYQSGYVVDVLASYGGYGDDKYRLAISEHNDRLFESRRRLEGVKYKDGASLCGNYSYDHLYVRTEHCLPFEANNEACLHMLKEDDDG